MVILSVAILGADGPVGTLLWFIDILSILLTNPREPPVNDFGVKGLIFAAV